MYKGRRDFFLALSPYVGLSSNSSALQFNWSAVAQDFKATGRGGPSERTHKFQGQPLKLLKVLLYSFITAYPMPYKAAIGKHWKNAAFPIVGCCPRADTPGGVTYPTALCLYSLHFQPWLFSRRLDTDGTRESSLVSDSSRLCNKAMFENAR